MKKPNIVMMKNIKATLFIVLFSWLTINTNAQDTIYVEHFDEDSLNLPNGWIADTLGFGMMSNNASTGYPGASGKNNVAISNVNSPSGRYELISKWVPTVQFQKLNLMFASRVTTKFYDSGSVVEGVYYRDNITLDWYKGSYNENSNNSAWGWTNFSQPISMDSIIFPADSIQIKWVVKIKSQLSGTYRIDDIVLTGEKRNGVKSFDVALPVKVYFDKVSGKFLFNEQLPEWISIIDFSGKVVYDSKSNPALPELKVGCYVLNYCLLNHQGMGSVKFMVF